VWNRLILEKKTFLQEIQNFAAFYGRARFINIFTKACNFFYPKPHESSPHTHDISLRLMVILFSIYVCISRSQWPRGLRRRSTAARLLRSWVRIPPGAWMFVCCECCVLSGRGLCDGLIILSEESYRLWRVVVCDHETSQARRLKHARWL